MSEYEFVSSDGERVPVCITTRRGLRNITLRVKTRPARMVCISKPWMVRVGTALQFLETQRRFVERALQKSSEKSGVRPGMRLPLFGDDVMVVHNPAMHSNRYSDDGARIIIGGGADMFERRLRDFIKKEFLIRAKDMIHACPRELWPRRVAVRDTTTRWGSCSSTGTISFSWRLAFAPLDVMRYVVMHEMAHRVHMDHSPEFWATVAEFYGFGVERAKRWLKVHGEELHRYL